jgi:hypothetical protein
MSAKAVVMALLGMVALGGGYYVANNIIPTHVRDTGQPANLDFANCSDGYTLRVSGTTITAGSLQDDGDGEIIIRGDDPRIGTPGAAWQGDQGDFIIGSAGNIAIGSAQAHVQLLAGSAVVVSDESCLGDGIIEPAPGKCLRRGCGGRGWCYRSERWQTHHLRNAHACGHRFAIRRR